MVKQVNFEDNIFILMVRIRMIRDIVTLDVDPELFLEKTLDDICFIDYTLRILLDHLRENNRLIEREELLEHLCELEWQFSRVLRELLDHEGNISIREIPAIKEKVNAFRINSQERRETAEALCPDKSGTKEETGVSSAELSELLKAL